MTQDSALVNGEGASGWTPTDQTLITYPVGFYSGEAFKILDLYQIIYFNTITILHVFNVYPADIFLLA